MSTPNLSELKQQVTGDKPVAQRGEPDFVPAPNLDKRLPREAFVKMECVGTCGSTYRANVFFKVPDAMDHVNIGKMKSILAPGGISGDALAAAIIDQICYLNVTIKDDSLPSWWAPLTATDFTPYSALYKEVAAYADRFQRPSDDGRSGDVDPGEAAGDDVGEPAPNSGGVGRRVQPPAERSEILVSNGA